VRLSVLELRTHLKLLQLSRQSVGSAGVVPISFQRWELPSGFGARSSAVCLGQRPRDLDSLLSGAARGRAAEHKLLIATGASHTVVVFRSALVLLPRLGAAGGCL